MNTGEKNGFTGYNGQLKNNARVLRRKMTEEERKLWFRFLRTYPVKWYRQRPIENYIVDFYCSKAKLIVELDGSQHFQKEGIAADSVRTERLEQYGMKVLRFSNLDVRSNFYGVCSLIDQTVKERTELF